MTTLKYTVKSGEGFAAIARHIFNQSPRGYIRSLVKRYDMVKQVATKLESDIKSEYHIVTLKPGMKVEVNRDIGYYIPRLALLAGGGSAKDQAKQKANKKPDKDNYFVIHNTESKMGDKKLNFLKDSKKVGAGHAYIKKNGEIVQIWPYNHPNGWATKAEWLENKPELRGKLVHIELIYGSKDPKSNEAPSEEQYQALADIYLETKKLFNRWLPIAAHREIDRGLKGGHRDPVNFDFDYFYTILKKKSVPIGEIEKQSQLSFNKEPLCDDEWIWPPNLRL